MLVLDTVRARNCGIWGYHRNTTPHLDALLAQSTQYRHAVSPAPWTLPAHVSLFTGEYTMAHGVRGYVYRDDGGKRRIRENFLPDEKRTIAEELLDTGFATGCFSANTGYMAPYFRLAQGFETYELERIPGVQLVDKALAWSADQDRPYFLFCNVMDAHRPYNLSPCPDTLPGDVSEDSTLLDRLREKTLAQPDSLDAELAAMVTAQYDRGIANADKALGRLIAGLKQRGDYVNALIVVCADHGEYLGEHGLVEHSKDVYEEAVHVPLLVKAPGQRNPRVVKTPVSLTQVSATIRRMAGLPESGPVPPLEMARSDYPILSENYFSRDWDFTDPRWPGRFDRIRTALYEDSWKLIHSTDDADELFNLADDPLEQNNLRASEAARYRAMRARCLDVMASHQSRALATPVPESVVPDAVQDALGALGYL